MHRIDGPGFAPGNLFTEGNPTLSIPATTVTDDIMNAFQEEIANVIEDQGITLVKGTQDQLLSAIKLLIGLGGDSQLNQAIANNTGPTDVTGLIFDKLLTQAAHVKFSINRQTATQDNQEVGEMHIAYDPKNDEWNISSPSSIDDAGVTFAIDDVTGQVSMTSDDLTGASYAGQLRISQILKTKL